MLMLDWGITYEQFLATPASIIGTIKEYRLAQHISHKKEAQREKEKQEQADKLKKLKEQYGR